MFSLVCKLEAGRTYMFKTGFWFYDDPGTGDYQIILKKAKEWEYESLPNGTISITQYNGVAEDLVIPKELDGKQISKIDSYAFSDSIALKNVTIPESVCEIGKCAFSYCNNLQNVTIEGSQTELGTGIFEACTKLENVTLPDGLTEIPDFLFYACEGLTELHIPNSVEKIGVSAFQGCDSLEHIQIPNQVNEIGGFAFDLCIALKEINIPASVEKLGDNIFYKCNNLKEISVDQQNPNYSSLDGSLYDKNQTMLIQYALGKSETAFTIPASVIGIGNSAFAGCSALSSVMIPENVEEIGAYAFDSCENLKVVSMEEGLKTIGDRAFWGCTNLGRITIPKSVYNITPEAFALKWDYESDQNCYVPVRVYEGSYAETQANAVEEMDCKVISELDGVTVSGTVTSYDKSTDAVILRLLDGTDEIDVIGTTGTAFEFTSVPAGSYTLEVSKKNHVTRTYEIEVDDTDVTQNVKIHLLGDINGDGRVTAMDYGRALAHVQKLQTLTGYELQCADTNQNGSITAMDYAQILAHVQKVSLLW